MLTTIDPCNIVFNMKEGSFKSPGNGSSYYNDLSCTYSAIAPQGKITVLAFDIFKLQEDPLCRFDVLKVYNGLSSEDQYIAMLCGYDVPESVVSLGREMLVTFKSDEMLSYEGFQASFVFLDESNIPRTSDCNLPEHSDTVPPYHGEESSPVPHSHTAVLQCNEGFKPEEPLNSQCTDGSFEPPLICIKGESFLQRRYILPHLTSTLEPVIYNLGFMDTDLANTTFVRVQTSTGRNLGNFYGGVINTFQHSLPEAFGQTWERSTLEVQSTGNVHLYISTTNFTNQFLGYPIDWLGTDYLISTSPPNPSSSIIVTATEVDTKLSVFFPSDFVLDNIMYSFEEDLRRTLSELQSFSIKTPFDPSGTYIKASKPVAVMMELRSEDRNKLKSCSSSFYVPPISSWGTSYSFAASPNSNISFSITAAYDFTMVTVIPQPESCGEGEYNLMLGSWSKKDFNNYIGCRIEVVSNQSVLVLMTEYSNVNICNTMVVPSKERAVKGIPGVPVFVSDDQASTNLKVWVSNGEYQSLQVDGDHSYTWEVIGEESPNGTIVETRVEQGYHVVSSTSEEARLLITVDKKLYAAHEESKEGTTVCPFDRLYYSGVELTFYATLPGRTAQSIEVCETTSSSKISLALRNCTDNSWEEPVLVACYSSEDVPTELERIANTTVTEENVDEIASEVALITSQTEDLTPTEVDNAADSLEAIVETGSTSPDVTDSVIGTVSNLMEIEEDTLANAGETSTVVVSLEQQVSNVQQNSDNFTEVVDNVGVKAVKIDPTITKAITFANLSPAKGNNDGDFYGDLTDEKTVLFNEEKEVKDENIVSSLYLPPKILQLAEEADPNNTRLPISFLIYKDSRLFQTQMSEEIVEGGMTIREDIFSQVITATVEIEDLVIDNLSSEDAVIARFATADVLGGSDIVLNRTCVFWVVGEDFGTGKWSDDGCYTNTTASDNGTETVCHCTHLTSFAVLFRVSHTEYEPIKSLDIITIVGTSLSVAGLTACIFTFVLVKKLRVKQPTKIHINLCLCLIGFYVSFLFGDLAIDKEPHCRNMATASHYFCLATIAWTCTEAVNMYFLFVKYSRSNNIKFFIPVSFTLCYGLPIIPTLLVYFLDDPRELKDYCFLHPGNSLYYGLLLEILIMIIFNIVMFTLVVRKVVFRPMMSMNAQSNRMEEVIARIQQFVVFWVLLGLSWTFGFLVAIPNRRTIAIEVLFCIFTSLQGFVLFFFICVKNPEIKKTFQKTTKRSFTKKTGYQMKDLPGSNSMFSLSKTDPKLQRIKSSKRQLVLDTEDAGVSISELPATDTTFTGMDLSEESQKQ
ncbi:Adhesion G-protein coupled receptor G4 [Holothuria leucospilota]|uniref:Adhesion G-protein coupled receptor G4 n=1 Tax=Holothuria leucospilota TaxID=206669 RepID=A0A9Q1BEF4_HOLLE|nr:Adhesion G-protein coupled receptor G4 [Holothuria leucospilota]